MELKDFYLFLKENITKISASSLFFGALGVVFYFLLPITYKSEGVIYVNRFPLERISSNFVADTRFFSEAEGSFYAQQTALSYTETVIGLFESVDVREKTLETLDISVTEESLRKLKRITGVKSTAPQLITLSVKSKSEGDASEIWKSLTNVTFETVKRLNEQGDPGFSIMVVNENPVVHAAYRNLYANLVVGVAFGLMGSTFVFALSKYLKE